MRKKFLAQLLEQMAPLTTDQEGRLHGGFCSLNACGDCDLNTNANCDCNSDCPPPGKEGERRTNAQLRLPLVRQIGRKANERQLRLPGPHPQGLKRADEHQLRLWLRSAERRRYF